MAAVQAPSVIAVHVQADVRDGFVVTNKGIQDSIKDLQRRLAKERGLRLAAAVETADLVLVVTERIDNAGSSAAISVPVAGTFYSVDVEKRAVRVRMEVGNFRQEFIGVNEYWSECAAEITADVQAWLVENRQLVIDLRSRRKPGGDSVPLH